MITQAIYISYTHLILVMTLFMDSETNVERFSLHSGGARTGKQTLSDSRVHFLTCSFPTEIMIKLVLGINDLDAVSFPKKAHFPPLNMFLLC